MSSFQKVYRFQQCPNFIFQSKKTRPKSSGGFPSEHSQPFSDSTKVVSGASARGESGETVGGVASANEGGSRSSKKRKRKMQKVNPAALLGFTVNAGERPNMGEIQSAKDVV